MGGWGRHTRTLFVKQTPGQSQALTLARPSSGCGWPVALGLQSPDLSLLLCGAP